MVGTVRRWAKSATAFRCLLDVDPPYSAALWSARRVGAVRDGTVRSPLPAHPISPRAPAHPRFDRIPATRIGGTQGLSAQPTPRRATCTSSR